MSVLTNRIYYNELAIPLIIQNIAGMLIGLVDEMFIGRISVQAYGAIGVSVSLMNLIAGIFGYFAVAFNIEGAKAKGQGNEDRFNQFFMSSILLDILIGVLYFFSVFIFGRVIFSRVYGLTNEALNAAVAYSYITSPYIFLQLIIFTLNSYFKITKNTKSLMYISSCATGMNALLDYLLIFGKLGFPKLGVTGAALASIISVSFNAIVLFLFAAKELKVDISTKSKYKSVSIKLIKESIPLVGEELLEGSIFVVIINAMISNIGITEMSSYLLVKSLIDIVLISMMIYIVLGIIFILFRNIAPMIISDEIDLIAYSSKLIIPMILMNLLNPIQTILKYVLQACEEANFVLYFTAIVNMVALGVIFALYLLEFKMTSIFIGLFINYFILSVMYYFRLLKKEILHTN